MVALALWLAGFGVAHAEPPPTLVLVAPPTPLVDAVTTGLGPWQIRVVVVTAPTPADQAAARYRAAYVATVRGTTLELFHVGEPGVQTRDVPTVIDDVAAAAIALTLKTWMRLGPPPTDGATPVAPPPTIAAPPPPPSRPTSPPRLAGFASVGFGVRVDQGGFGAAGQPRRAAADVTWQRGPWRLGATAALTAVPSDLEIRGQLRVTAPARVEPWLAISAGLQLP